MSPGLVCRTQKAAERDELVKRHGSPPLIAMSDIGEDIRAIQGRHPEIHLATHLENRECTPKTPDGWVKIDLRSL